MDYGDKQREAWEKARAASSPSDHTDAHADGRDIEARAVIAFLRHEATGSGPQKAHWMRDMANRIERGEHR